MNLRSIYMICKNNYDVLDMFAGEETLNNLCSNEPPVR